MGNCDRSELRCGDLLLQEFQEAWNHYRHLENERSWSLAFMFTITIGAIGWIGKILSEPELKESKTAHFSTMLIMGAVCALGITIYARVSRTRFVLRHYVKAWRFVRMKFYGKTYEELNRKLDVYYDRSVQSYFGAGTFTTIWMIWAVIIGSFAYLILGAIGAWPHLMLDRIHRVVVAILALSLFLFASAVIFRVRRAKAMSDARDYEPGGT